MTRKKSPAQLDSEIARALASRTRHPSHATKHDRAADLIANYGTWTSSYSNEDLDRAQGLANRLTAIDREEGRAAPPVGFSAKRYEQAKQVVSDANRYGEKQQKLRASGHARKKNHATRQGKQTVYDVIEVNSRTKNERVIHRHFSTKADAKETVDEYKALKKPDITYRIKSRLAPRAPFRWNLED